MRIHFPQNRLFSFIIFLCLFISGFPAAGMGAAKRQFTLKSYQELKALVRSRGIKSEWQYRDWFYSNESPNDIPLHPERVYSSEWEGAQKFFRISAREESLIHDRDLAERGSIQSQYKLALRYHTGDGVEQNLTEAIEWYKKAAARGHAEAQYTLAVRYYEGDGVEKNSWKAFKWYKLAAWQGHIEAQYSLAYMYKEEWYERNLLAAFKWYRRAAAQGHREAQRSLDNPEFAEYILKLHPVFDRLVRSLNLSTRIQNALSDEGYIYYLDELVEMTEQELLKIPSLGKKSLDEVKTALASLGLEFGMDKDWVSVLTGKIGSNKTVLNLARPISDLELTVRSQNALVSEEIYYLGGLVKMREEDLRKMPNIGLKSRDEIKATLTPLGLKLGLLTEEDWPSNPKQVEILVKEMLMFRQKIEQEAPKKSDGTEEKRRLETELISKVEELISVIPPVLARPLSDTELTVRTANALAESAIYYIGDLVRMNEEDLWKIPGIAANSIAEIKAKLTPLGLKLGMTVENWPSDSKLKRKLIYRLNGVFKSITSREGRVLKMRFGIGENRRTQKEMGEIFNVSTGKIGEIQGKALRKLYQFGYLSNRIPVLRRPSDLTSEQVQMLLGALHPEMLADNGACPAAWKN